MSKVISLLLILLLCLSVISAESVYSGVSYDKNKAHINISSDGDANHINRVREIRQDVREDLNKARAGFEQKKENLLEKVEDINAKIEERLSKLTSEQKDKMIKELLIRNKMLEQRIDFLQKKMGLVREDIGLNRKDLNAMQNIAKRLLIKKGIDINSINDLNVVDVNGSFKVRYTKEVPRFFGLWKTKQVVEEDLPEHEVEQDANVQLDIEGTDANSYDLNSDVNSSVSTN